MDFMHGFLDFMNSKFIINVSENKYFLLRQITGEGREETQTYFLQELHFVIR